MGDHETWKKKDSEEQLLMSRGQEIRNMISELRQQADWEDDAKDHIERNMATTDPQSGRWQPYRRPFSRPTHSKSFDRNSSGSRTPTYSYDFPNFSRNQFDRDDTLSLRSGYFDLRSTLNSSLNDNQSFSGDTTSLRSFPRRRGRGGRGPRQRGSNSRQNSNSETVSVISIANALSECSFTSTLLNLMEKFNLNFQGVKKVANANKHIFQLDKETISLMPKCSICKDHIKEGCSDISLCKDLHICLEYVNGRCKNRECLFGHFWKTNHNISVLNRHGIGFFKPSTLINLFKSSIKPPVNATPLKICKNYNDSKECKKNCKMLHLCLRFIAGKCVSSTCDLNHNVADGMVANLLGDYGISINESPRDVLNIIKCSVTVKQQITSLSDSDTNHSRHSDVSSPAQIEEKVPTALAYTPPPKIKTLWSHGLQGDVTKPEICYASVESACHYEETGCWRLHSSLHFHWQVKDQTKGWLNLPMEQVFDLEKGFCSVETESVLLSPVDPASLDKSARGLLLTMKGRRQWEADFNTMTLKLPEGKDQLDLRRLTTEVTENETPPPCLYEWYFSDINSKWIAYGKTDSAGKENLKCDHDSEAIEKKYNLDRTALIQFSNQEFNYILDPVHMVQTNLKTNVTRAVRRRPLPHFKEETKPVAEKNIGMYDLPGYWEPMDLGVPSLLFTIPHSSDEYQQISTHLTQKGGNYNILKVERVQNPYVWRAFQNKVKEIEALYKDPGSVNIQQLFHGTSPDNVAKIVKENFDWRMHGTNVGQIHGRGTYFASMANTSYSYTQPDASNQRFMFVAKVIVGKVSLGNGAMARPPINPITQMPYESTVDNITNPGIIVKYDKQEYYPEYILTLG